MKNDWKRVLIHLTHDVEDTFDRYKYRLKDRLGGPGPIKIIPYRGYGNSDRIYIKGRVLEDHHEIISRENDNVWDNLLNMYRRLESDEIPHAQIKARFQGAEQDIVANEEGFFDAWITPPRPLANDQLWQEIELELVSPLSDQDLGRVQTKGQALIPPPSARFAVISDIDDTVLRTDATHMAQMARNVFLGNARTRLPFPGVAALYRALYHGASGNEMNPLFYVSSSPWNLYDLFSEFFNLQDIPIGPVLFLRDWGLTNEEMFPTGHRTHKLRVIRQMLDFYPDLPFILIGDSGQEDPEIYAEVAREYPSRILAAYIRNVSHGLDRLEAIRNLAEEVVAAGSTLILAEDTTVISQHATEKGWIAPETLPAVQVEKKKDEAPPTLVETLISAGEKPQKEAVVVEGENKEETRAAVEGGVIEQALDETGQKKKGPPPIIVNPKPEDEGSDR